VTCEDGSAFLVGLGTCPPASTDDSSDVGGSTTGRAPKSCALVPGSAAKRPSLTAWVLELRCGAKGGRTGCGSAASVAGSGASAFLLRAHRVLDLSLSIATARWKTGMCKPQGNRVEQHGFITWKRRAVRKRAGG